MMQGILVAAETLVGQAQAAVRAGEDRGVAELLAEAQFGQVALERFRIIREVPMDAPEQVKEIHLQPEVLELLGADQAVPGPGEPGQVIAPPALQVDDSVQGAERRRLRLGIPQRLLGGGEYLIAVG